MGGSTGAGAFGMQPSTVSPFGQPAASGFGGLSGGFGQPAAATPAFGAGSGMFGAAAPASGGMFGQQTTQSAFGQPQQQPSTGFSFGQPAAQPAAGGMFGAPAATPAFGTTPAFGAAQPFSATPAFGTPAGFGQPAAATSAFGGLGGGFGGFGQPAAAAATGFGAPAAAPAFGAFGAPAAKSAFGSFAFGSPTTQPAAGGMFGAPAAAPAFGAPAATNAFGAPAAALNFGAAPAFGAATSGFGDASRLGGLGGFSTAAPTGFGAAAAPAFSAAPTATTGGMFGSLGAFGQAPAASPAAFGGFGGFGATAAAKPFSLGFSAAPAAASSWGMSAGAFGAPAAQFGAFGAPVAGQQATVQQVQLTPMEQKMELLRTKNQKLDIQLKDDRIYTSRGPDTASLYSTTTFSVPRSLPSYQHTSRSTAKIVPRGVISSATMTMTGLQRPLSSVLSAASSGGATADMMSPEKLLGRSAKRLIIVSSGFNNSDPTIDLPLPSYQQKQAVRALQNVTEEAVSPPRALMLNAHRDRDQRRPSGGYNGGDVTGLTPSNNRSPFTPTNGDMGSGPSSPRTPVSGSDVSGSIQDRPSKAATGQRMATPYLRGEREMESLDNSVNSNSKHDSESSSMTFDAPMPPTLLRPGYITAPSMAVLKKMTKKELSHVRNFAVYRPNIGKIEWEGDTDVRGLDLDLIVNIEKRGVEVYDSEEAELIKPAVGQGLNKPAIVYLDNIFPPDDASELKKSQFLSKLKKICLKSGSEFMDYDAEHGQWSFRVEHFSRYGLDDSDDEEEPVIRRLPLPIRKSPIVLSAAPPLQGTVQDDVAMEIGSDDVIQTPVPAATIGTNKQYLQYTLSASGSNQADLERMRLSFAKPSNIPGEGTGLGLPMQSTIFTPRKVAFSASSGQPEVAEKAKQEQQQQQQQQMNGNAQSDSAYAMPVPESIPVIIAPTHEAYAEVIAAVREAEQCPFHLTADSPCMQLLLQVKAEYLSSTGQRQEVVKRQPVLTRVAGVGGPVAKVLQKHPVNAALSMGRSFRVGWGPNGEIVHAGQLLFNASDATYGKSHRVVVEKIDTVRWVEEKTLGDELMTMQTTPSAAMDSCEAMLKVVLSHSFVFDCTAKADMDIHAPQDDLSHSKKLDENDNDDNGLLPNVPLWRAPYAKPWELNEYLPYLNTLEDLMKTSLDRNITSSNPDWVLSKAIELVAAVSGQEQGSYATAKQLYGYIGNGNKMGLNKQRIEQEQSTIQKLNDLRSELDFMPLYEDREGHEAIDWGRRREAISAWLVNITTVEGTYVTSTDNME